ncbi:MAG: precorrin-6A reductase [Negativicutes bacterium]|nr:precorrin-6A reductase [Negativicutes bacterium]
MILVVAGTRDGREMALELAAHGYPVLVSVVSDYGRRLIEQDNLPVNACPLDEGGFAELIGRRGIRAVVDVSHPYASGVSVNVQAACRQQGIPYLRYERLSSPLPDYPRLHVAPDATAAAKTAAALGKVVFLTTGSRTLPVFKQEPLLADHRLIARVLPEPQVIEQCLALGFTPGEIVAVQGPFSHEFNVALFKEYNSEVIVTKNSGLVGGADSKFSAAIELGLELIVIDRPQDGTGNCVSTSEAVVKFVEEVFG